MSPVLYLWLGIVISSFAISTADAPKLIGFTNVLRVVSSYSIWNEVVMPGVNDIVTLSFACNLCASLHTTVATTFSAKPVISGFCGVKLWTTPVPCPLKNNWYAVDPIPVTDPVDPIATGFVDNPSKFTPSLIANTGELFIRLKVCPIPFDTKSGFPVSLEYKSLSPVLNPWFCKKIFWLGTNISVDPPPTTLNEYLIVEPIPTPDDSPKETLSIGLKYLGILTLVCMSVLIPKLNTIVRFKDVTNEALVWAVPKTPSNSLLTLTLLLTSSTLRTRNLSVLIPRTSFAATESGDKSPVTDILVIIPVAPVVPIPMPSFKNEVLNPIWCLPSSALRAVSYTHLTLPTKRIV